MLTQEDVVEIHALRRRGWTIAAIARHTGRDPKTIRRRLSGWESERGSAPSPLEPWRRYLEARFADESFAKTAAEQFIERLLACGTTTAMVFGSQFYEANAALFEAAGRSGSRRDPAREGSLPRETDRISLSKESSAPPHPAR